jgi:nicotinamidase-related amidase
MDITEETPNIKIFPKTKFSMYLPEIKSFVHEKGIKTVILCGVETHVCVQQTTLDLLADKISVFVIADGCSSRSLTDRLYAFERLRQAGAIITTHESVLFQLIGDKEHEKFKEIQALVKDKSPDTGLLHIQSLI